MCLIYINHLRDQIDKNCEVVQYADDTLLLASAPIQRECKTIIEKNVILLTKYFTSLKLQLNPSKTEFILFSRNRNFSEYESIKIGNEIITESKSVKYFGVHIDKNLSFQDEVKHLLKKMAGGIKTIYTLRNRIPTFLMKTVLNAFVISHLLYSLLLIQSVDKNLLISLEKQLNWAIRAFYSRNRMDSTKDLKIEHSILPVEYLIKLNRTTYMWKLRNCFLPPFNPLDVTTLPTWCIRQNLRSCDIFFDSICHTQKLERSIVKTASKDWNSLPKELSGLEKKKTFPKELKKIYTKSFFDNKQYTTYGSVSWKSIRFKKVY